MNTFKPAFNYDLTTVASITGTISAELLPVKFISSMGQGSIVWADGQPVENAPVVDFDYRDDQFDADLKAICYWRDAVNQGA